jgi:hypothetical protein
MSDSKIKIVKCSGPNDYEYLTWEVQLSSEPLLAVDREKGVNCLEVEIFGRYEGYGKGKKISLDDLISALIQIKNKIQTES